MGGGKEKERMNDGRERGREWNEGRRRWVSIEDPGR